MAAILPFARSGWVGQARGAQPPARPGSRDDISEDRPRGQIGDGLFRESGLGGFAGRDRPVHRGGRGASVAHPMTRAFAVAAEVVFEYGSAPMAGSLAPGHGPGGDSQGGSLADERSRLDRAAGAG